MLAKGVFFHKSEMEKNWQIIILVEIIVNVKIVTLDCPISIISIH